MPPRPQTECDSLPLDDDARAFIDSLPDAEQAKLDALIAAAAVNQRAALETALDGAVGMVPAPLRKRVRKLFLG